MTVAECTISYFMDCGKCLKFNYIKQNRNITDPPFQLFVNLKTIDLDILTVYIHAETLGLVVFEHMIWHVPLTMV